MKKLALVFMLAQLHASTAYSCPQHCDATRCPFEHEHFQREPAYAWRYNAYTNTMVCAEIALPGGGFVGWEPRWHCEQSK